MGKDNLVSFNKKEPCLPSNLVKVEGSELVRIPILNKFRVIDGEVYYQFGNDRLKRMSDYSLDDFK